MSDFIDDLRAFMDQVETNELNINKDQSFKIESREQANYFLRRIIDLRAQKDDIELTAKKEIERLTGIITEWRNNEISKVDNSLNYYSTLLEEFATEQLKETNKKSIKLPFGSIGFKKQQPHFDYEDDVVKQWLEKEYPDLLEKTVNINYNKTNLKKIGTVNNDSLFIDGKKVEGILVTKQDDKFEIK